MQVYPEKKVRAPRGVVSVLAGVLLSLVAAPVIAQNDISGSVLEDVNGDGNLGDAVARNNTQVRLYRDGGDGQPDGVDDVFLSPTSTDPSGNYSFTSLSAGTYWVLADSKTVTPSAGLNGGFVQGDVWPEQTYGTAGAWCDNGAGSPAELGTAGTCFGGQVSTSSDDASVLSTAEHVSRVVIVASNVANVDFGFSFAAMANTLAGDAQDDDGGANRTVQGSLRQFIQNANAVAGANVLRFTPAGPTNATDGGGNNWWRLTVTAVLPAITDPNTTVDGIAYNRVNGVSVLDTNPTLLGFVGTVGLGADAVAGTADEPTLSGVPGPELEIVNDRATNVVIIGLDLQANDLTVRRIASYGFGNGNLFRDANIRVGVNSGGTNFTGTLIENNVIGSSAASYTDPGAAARTLVNDIAILGADTGTIRNNLIGYAGRFGIFLSDTAVGWTVQGNELRANAVVNASQDSLDIGNGSSGTTVRENLFVLSDGGGVDSYRGLGGNLIENNTFSQNGQFGSEPAALRIFGNGNTIRLNDIDGSIGPGILLVSDIGQQGSPSIQNRITQNRFSGNGSNAIDLLALGGNASLGDGITLNDAATDPQAGNIGLDYPLISSAVFSAGTTTVTGTTCASCDVEVYKAVAGAGDTLSGIDYGEGVEFAGTTTANGAGAWTVAGITSLAPGDNVSAIAIDPAGNTSEFSGNVPVSSAAVGTVYYSVGTSVADFKNGAPTVTISTGTATFTTSQPANVGVGDEITYSGGTKAYISGRTSASVYTVTTATGLVPPDVGGATVNSITRAFNTLKVAATDSLDATHLNTFDLVAGNIQLNLACYNDGPDPSSYVRIEEPWITGPTNYIRVFTPTLSSEVGIFQRHTGVAGTGYRIAPTGPAGTDFFNFILVSTDTGYVRVEGVEIDGSGLTAGENVRGLMANDSATSQDVRFAHNLIHDITNTTIDDTDNSRVFGIFLDSTDNSKVANNIIYNLTSVSTYSQGQARGIEGDDPGKTHHVYNNTLYNIRATATAGSATGILDTGGNTVFARNNYVGLVDSALGGEACFSGSFAAENNNVASDATAVGAGSQINQSAYASYFVNVTPGSEDLHLLDDSNALWGTSGADLDSDPNLPVTEDIDREPRHTSTPDIGADEVSVSVNYRSIGSYSTGDASITAATTTVLFAGSASLPTDVQPGDQLTINPGGGNEETLTIASRDSATQVTVSGPAASTHTNEPYLLFWQYTIGDATVALGSSTVTFGGGASLPAKTGLGDRLVIGGETFHVLTRDSVTQVTVDNGAVSAHTAAGYTLKRAYQTL